MSSEASDGSKKKRYCLSDNFLGTVTVGERGQIVIPVEARKKFGIETGDKLLVVGHGEKGMMVLKMDALRDFMTRMMEDLERVEEEYQRHDTVKQNAPEDND